MTTTLVRAYTFNRRTEYALNDRDLQAVLQGLERRILADELRSEHRIRRWNRERAILRLLRLIENRVATHHLGLRNLDRAPSFYVRRHRLSEMTESEELDWKNRENYFALKRAEALRRILDAELKKLKPPMKGHRQCVRSKT